MVDCQLPVRALGEELECNVGLALPYHEVYDDQALVYDSPGRVAQSVGEGAKDFSNACLAGVCCDEDMFDILGLGRCELRGRVSLRGTGEQLDEDGDRDEDGGKRRIATLILVPPFTLFSKELAMGHRGILPRRQIAARWAR